MSKSVYIPVCVDIDDEGKPVSAYIDYWGAPWMYVGDDDVFNDDTGDWESSSTDSDNAELVDNAESWLATLLRVPFLAADPTYAPCEDCPDDGTTCHTCGRTAAGTYEETA